MIIAIRELMSQTPTHPGLGIWTYGCRQSC
ncbi:unnamed protein product, partial [Vitis vinifera]|uniref:Uncharacterized protein n=1 Tax=Vitis vinifera TaxID=29760 RepID=D7U9J2_VITVI